MRDFLEKDSSEIGVNLTYDNIKDQSGYPHSLCVRAFSRYPIGDERPATSPP